MLQKKYGKENCAEKTGRGGRQRAARSQSEPGARKHFGWACQEKKNFLKIIIFLPFFV